MIHSRSEERTHHPHPPRLRWYLSCHSRSSSSSSKSLLLLLLLLLLCEINYNTGNEARKEGDLSHRSRSTSRSSSSSRYSSLLLLLCALRVVVLDSQSRRLAKMRTIMARLADETVTPSSSCLPVPCFIGGG